ncbi:hypothetical protein C9446_04830 [Providencia heimbachae]|uniref:WG repeat-containing protein n=1 Tax=Providencia heimbachae TaxID=333962 RepID=UPI0010BE2D62|nr:WG repeat-containing protein [Providencia heimbachae]QCJ69244.1 hypothetical protein C9446_04830 [Providencia heimbachae]
MVKYLISPILLVALSFSLFADNLDEQYTLWVNDQQNEIKCFESSSPYQYCLRLDPNGGLYMADSQGNEIYRLYYFDNWPDEAKEGLYRIRKGDKIGFADEKTGKIVVEAKYDCAFPFENGKARVGVGCRTETDGEHSWWVGGEWTVIYRN